MLFPTYSESPHYVQYMPQASIHSCVLCCVVLCPLSSCEWYQMTGVAFTIMAYVKIYMKILEDFRNFNKSL